MLRATRSDHTLANNRRRLTSDAVDDRAHRDSRDVDDEIDAIAERTGEAVLILRDLYGRTPARPAIVAGKPAGARVHRTDENKARREDCGPCGARDRHVSLFEGLPEDFEDTSIEFRHFIHEEDPVMREGDFARPWNGSAAYKRNGRNRVVRRTKRAL
jgi:hypothetical protein